MSTQQTQSSCMFCDDNSAIVEWLWVEARREGLDIYNWLHSISNRSKVFTYSAD